MKRRTDWLDHPRIQSPQKDWHIWATYFRLYKSEFWTLVLFGALAGVAMGFGLQAGELWFFAASLGALLFFLSAENMLLVEPVRHIGRTKKVMVSRPSLMLVLAALMGFVLCVALLIAWILERA